MGKKDTLVIEGYAQDQKVSFEYYKKEGNNYSSFSTRPFETEYQPTGSYTDPVSGKKISSVQKFKITLDNYYGKLEEGHELTAIAIDNNGNTSEFSPPVIVAEAGTISVKVWHDKNLNSVQDPDEAGLDNIKLALLKNNMEVAYPEPANTDEHGSFTFKNLNPGTYQIHLLPDQNQLVGLVLAPQFNNPATVTITDDKPGEALFGYIEKTRELILAPNHNRTAIAGTQVILPHKLIGPAGKTVKLKPELLSKEQINWPVTLKKSQCDKSAKNEAVDIRTQVAISEIELDNNGQACLEARFFVPANTPTGLLASLKLNASVTIDTDNNIKILEAKAIDTIRVVDSASGSLSLEKTVQNLGKEDNKNSEYKDSKPVTSNKAAPGEILEYTITFTNIGSGPITDLEIRDRTPVFTFLESISCNTLKSCSTEQKYQRGYTGELIWSFSQKIAPGEQGEVSYRVKIE